MSVSGVCTDSRGLRPCLELLSAVLLIPSPHAPGNKRGKKKSLVSSAAPDFFPDSLPYSCSAPAPSGCVHAANPSPLPGICTPKPEPQLPAPALPGGWADKPLGLVSAGRHQSSVRESLRFALHTPVAALSSVAPKFPPSATRRLLPRWGFLVCGNLSS